MKVNGDKKTVVKVDGELLNILSVHHDTTDAPIYFQLIAALALLKQNLVNANGE